MTEPDVELIDWQPTPSQLEEQARRYEAAREKVGTSPEYLALLRGHTTAREWVQLVKARRGL